MGFWSNLYKKLTGSANKAAQKQKKRKSSGGHTTTHSSRTSGSSSKSTGTSSHRGGSSSSSNQRSSNSTYYQRTQRQQARTTQTTQKSAYKARVGSQKTSSTNKTTTGPYKATVKKWDAKDNKSSTTSTIDKMRRERQKKTNVSTAARGLTKGAAPVFTKAQTTQERKWSTDPKKAYDRYKREDRAATGITAQEHELKYGDKKEYEKVRKKAEKEYKEQHADEVKKRLKDSTKREIAFNLNGQRMELQQKQGVKLTGKQFKKAAKQTYKEVKGDVAAEAEARLNKEAKKYAKKVADEKVGKSGTLKSKDLSMEDFYKLQNASRIGGKLGNKALGKDLAEKVGSQTAYSAGKNKISKVSTGIMQGLAYGDVLHGGVESYNKDAKGVLKDVKKSTAYNVGYGVGQMAGFATSGTAGATKALTQYGVKAGSKATVKAGAKSAGKQFMRNRAIEGAIETPMNVLDAAKMSRDENGKVNTKEFAKYLAMNTALTGAAGGAIEGIGLGITRAQGKELARLKGLQKTGGLDDAGKVRLQHLEKKLLRAAEDVAVPKSSVASEALGIKTPPKADSKEMVRLSVKRETGTLTEKEAARLDTLTKEAADIAKQNDKIRADLRNSMQIKAETLNKLSKETGVEYKVASNDEIVKALKDNGKDVEDGVFINGVSLTTKDGKRQIFVNKESDQAHSVILGHETTHLLSGTQHFDALKNTVKDFADSLGEYDVLRNEFKNIYDSDMKGMTKEEADKFLDEEVTSELVGRYLFGENAEKFVRQLSTSDRNVFQRIYDYIVDAIKSATGDAELRQLNAIKDNFDKAYKELGETPESLRAKTDGADFSKSIADIDTKGNALSKEQQEFFAETTLRQKNGKLKVLYHGSPNSFNVFKPGDVGFHLGSKSQARARVGAKGNVVEYYGNLKNPIEFDTDLGSWDADYRLTNELAERGIIGNDEAKSILRTEEGKKRATGDANKRLRELLKEKGYDGIAYKNFHEGSGNSYILFDPSQVKRIDNVSPTDSPDVRFSKSFDQKNPPQGGSFDARNLDQYKDADNFDDFVDANFNLLSDNYKSFGKTKYGGDQMEEVWRMKRSETLAKSAKEMSEEDAVQAIRDGIRDSHRAGWFRNGDSAYKPNIVNQILGNDNVLNAGWNMMHRHYKEMTGSNISFKEFMDTPVTLYRGERGQGKITDDIFNAYSFDREMAIKHADGNSEMIDTLEIKPSETWGSYQTTAEAEVLVPEYRLENARFSKSFDPKKPREGVKAEPPENPAKSLNTFDPKKPREGVEADTTSPVEFNEGRTFNPKEAREGVTAEPPESPVGFTKPGEERDAALEGIRDKRFKKDKQEVAPGEVKDDLKSLDGMSSAQLEAEIAGTRAHLNNAINKYKDYKEKHGEEAPRVKQLREHLADAEAAAGKEPKGGYASLGEDELPKGLRKGELDEDYIREPVFGSKAPKDITFDDFNKAQKGGSLSSIAETKAQQTVIERTAQEVGKIREAIDRGMELFVDDLHAYEALGRSIKDKAARERFMSQVNQMRVAKRMGRTMVEDTINPLYEKHGLLGKRNVEKKNVFEQYVFLTHNIDRIKQGTDIYGGFLDEKELFKARADKEAAEVGINDTKKEIKNREKLHLDPDPRLDAKIARFEEQIKAADERVEELKKDGIERVEAVLKDIRKQYPDVTKFQQSVVKFADDLNKRDLESGIIGRDGEKGYDTLKELYPNYVPTYRNKVKRVKDIDGNESIEDYGFDELVEMNTIDEIDIGRGMLKAKGGAPDDQLVPLYNQLIAKANTVAKRTEQNRMAQMIADVMGDVKPTEIPSAATLQDALEAVPKVYEKDGKHRLIYYDEGKPQYVDISPAMAREMRHWSGEEKLSILGYKLGTDPLTKGVRPVARTFKAAITDYNVIFGMKNFVRDQQTALLYTKDIKGYVAAYPKVCAAMMPEKIARMFPKRVRDYCARYRKLYRTYMANGGKYSALVKSTDDLKIMEKWRKANPFEWASDFNSALETVPRMQEFASSIDADVRKLVDKGMSRDEAYDKILADHDAVSKAIYRSKDVTLNFDRGGTLGKWINSSFVPFFNPAIQGLDKVARFLIKDNKSATDWVKMMGFLSVGVAAPGALWEMRFGEDKDYQSLTNYYKDNYYCLPVGDGKFIKIPKARELGALQNPIDHMIRHTEYGQPGDWKEMFVLGYQQIGPVSPVEDNLFAPIYRVANNKNWFGGQIENKYDQRLIAQGESDQVYDEKTSLLAINIGKQKWFKEHGISPKKIDNVMDSYLGVVYDMGIGQFNQANNSSDPTSKKVLQTGLRILDTNFVVDSYISHKYAGAFYDKESELNLALDNAEKGTQAYRDAAADKRRFNANYSYDNMTYQQVISDIKNMDNISTEKKNALIREFKKEQRDFQRDSYDGKAKSNIDIYDTLIKKFGLNKTINKYTYTSKDAQGGKNNSLKDAWDAYKKTPEYKKNGGRAFNQMYRNMRKFNTEVGESKNNIDFNVTAFLLQDRKSKGQTTEGLQKAFDVWSMKTAEEYFNKYGGNLETYTKTHKKVVQSSINLGYDYTSQIDDAEKAVALAKGKTLDRGYFAERVDRKTNPARCASIGHGWTDERLSKWAHKNDIDCKKCDNWSKYHNGKCSPEYVAKCIEKNSKEPTREGKAAIFALYFPYEENPFGKIGDYSLDGDVGVSSGGGWGGWGYGRRGRRGWGGGWGGGSGGSGGGATEPTAGVKASTTDNFKAPSKARVSKAKSTKAVVTDTMRVRDYTRPSNLNDAYRKKARKLREQASKTKKRR